MLIVFVRFIAGSRVRELTSGWREVLLARVPNSERIVKVMFGYPFGFFGLLALFFVLCGQGGLRAAESTVISREGGEWSVVETVNPAEPAPALAWDALREDLAPSLNEVWIYLAVRAGLPRLYAAVLMEDGERVEDWLAKGGWSDERTSGGDRALALALRLGQTDLMRQLAWAGADVEFSEADGQFLLVLATLRRQSDAVHLLLAMGADPDAKTQHPMDPALIEMQAVKDLRQSLERDRELTPLMIATARGDVAGVEYLLSVGASQRHYTRVNKRYAINFASLQGYNYIMQLLLGRRPGEESEQRVVISLGKQRAVIYRDGEEVDSSVVSTGRKGYATPAGTFVITNKHTSWISTIYKVPMPWFMRLSCSSIGLHAGNIPGYPASHGCIRLPSAKAKQFFAQLRVGDVVEIAP
jgi:hypothetical protein